MTFNAQAVLDDTEQALDAILEDLRSEAAEYAKADAPVVTGAYREGIEATDEGVAGTADHSIFVELRHNTIGNAVERVKRKADSIASRHKL
jgi:hypothetical protein